MLALGTQTEAATMADHRPDSPIHLGAIPISQIARLRAIDWAAQKVCDLRESHSDIQSFLTRHGAVVMAWSDEGGYYHNANHHPEFSSIIVKVKH